MYGADILTLIEELHIFCDSCMAMRQKAVIDVFESLPFTSPYTQTHKKVRTIINIIKNQHNNKMLLFSAKKKS